MSDYEDEQEIKRLGDLVDTLRAQLAAALAAPAAEQAVPQMVDVGNHYGATSDGMGNWTCSVCERHLGNGTAPMVCTGKPAPAAEQCECGSRDIGPNTEPIDGQRRWCRDCGREWRFAGKPAAPAEKEKH